MANVDPDVCVPQTLTDFVFDLYDSVTLSQLTEEQTRLYTTVFRDLSGKYFASTPWPSPQSIASECNGDPLFLAIYRELTYRHWHAVSRPSLRDRIEGWDVYRELFEELLENAESNAYVESGQPNLFMLPEWTFDILHEFVYQFQGFCQFRTTLYASATKHNLIGGPKEGDGAALVAGTAGEGSHKSSSGKVPHHVIENLSIMQQDNSDLVEGSIHDIWNVEQVLGYLNRLVTIGTNPKCTAPAYQYFGIFASVTLSRLECLLSDYTGCLEAGVPLMPNPNLVVKKHDQPTKTYMEVIHGVFPARLSLAYHMGISFLMLRQYKNAVTTIGSLCTYMQRGFKTGQLRKLPNSDQLFKNYDRLIALLALASYLCPVAVSSGLIEESLLKVIREKHGSQLSKEAFADLFMFCSPKFISPAIPDYQEAGFPLENAYKHQVKLLDEELKCHSTFKQLRSYLKLYTSLDISKLETFGTIDGADGSSNKKEPIMEETTLVSMKLVQRQLENPTVGEEGGSTAASAGKPELKSALDIHYYVQDGTILIDKAEKHTRRFENYFLSQMEQSYDIRKDVHNISTEV